MNKHNLFKILIHNFHKTIIIFITFQHSLKLIHCKKKKIITPYNLNNKMRVFISIDYNRKTNSNT